MNHPVLARLFPEFRPASRHPSARQAAEETGALFFPQHPLCTYSQVTDLLCRKGVCSKPAGLVLKNSSIPSGGSLASMELVCDGRSIQAGIVQFDALAGAPEECRRHVKIVLRLYQETMLFFMRKEHGTGSLSDVAAALKASDQELTIACLGKESSQSYRNLQAILDHHGFHDRINVIACDYQEAVSKLKSGLVDGVFIVGSTQHSLVRKLADDPLFVLHSLDDREGLKARFHGLALKRIHARSLSPRQMQPVQTLSTDALLVISDRVSSATAASLYDWLMANQRELKQQLPILEIQPPGEEMQEWLHEGVARRLEPEVPLKDKHGTFLAFATLGIGLIGTTAAVGSWLSRLLGWGMP